MKKSLHSIPRLFKKYIKKLGKLSDSRLPKTLNPYLNIRFLKPIKIKIESKNYLHPVAHDFSLILVIKNEEGSLPLLLESIEKQSRKPSEIIIVDGGSTDATTLLIDAFIAKTNIVAHLYIMPERTISEGENFAIMQAKNEIIVSVHAGCELESTCLNNLVASMTERADVDLAGGIYRSSKKSDYFIPDWDNINWDSYLPSSRILCFKKSLAVKAKLFPKYLETGEDTLFGINYRRLSKKWVFNKKAVIWWENPAESNHYLKTLYRYAQGDGQTGIGDYLYNSHYLFLKDKLTAKKYIEGYVDGKRKRLASDILLRKVRGYVYIFSNKMLFENKTNKKLIKSINSYINRNYRVHYISPTLHVPAQSFEKKLTYIPVDFSNLELISLEKFSPEKVRQHIGDNIMPIIVINQYTGRLWSHKIQKLIRISRKII